MSQSTSSSKIMAVVRFWCTMLIFRQLCVISKRLNHGFVDEKETESRNSLLQSIHMTAPASLETLRQFDTLSTVSRRKSIFGDAVSFHSFYKFYGEVAGSECEGCCILSVGARGHVYNKEFLELPIVSDVILGIDFDGLEVCPMKLGTLRYLF